MMMIITSVVRFSRAFHQKSSCFSNSENKLEIAEGKLSVASLEIRRLKASYYSTVLVIIKNMAKPQICLVIKIL